MKLCAELGLDVDCNDVCEQIVPQNLRATWNNEPVDGLLYEEGQPVLSWALWFALIAFAGTFARLSASGIAR